MPKITAIPRPTHDYIGLTPCGCAVVVIVDVPSAEKITAREVADLIREGLKAKRIPIADLHKYLPLGCKRRWRGGWRLCRSENGAGCLGHTTTTEV